jgi:hemerythrin-like domain-containing protein
VYVDRLHHGKEEDILFKSLQQKKLSEEDGRLMTDLIAEHVAGRATVNALAEANLRYRQGAKAELAELTACLTTIVSLYPKHIGKEDKIFFPAAQGYLSKEEDQAMIAQFWEFDRKMIHEKYRAVIQGLERP